MDGLLRSTFAFLTGPDQVAEVRALTSRGVLSGYFKDREALVQQVTALDADPDVQGIYLTLNEVNPALLARRANRIRQIRGKEPTTGDTDILLRRWLPIDIDPVRPSGVSSTDAEHDLALAKAGRIAGWLAECGFPDPIRADSGNGAHLLYRVDLPNDDESTRLVKQALETLNAFFSDALVTVDTANHNAARIWRLYGTMSRKGDSTPERPHRRSHILSAPEELQIVHQDLLRKLSECLPSEEKAEQPKPKRKHLDLNSWLNTHGIGVRSVKPYEGGTLFVLDECPFSSAHKDGSFAIQFGNGAIYAGCHHNSCGGGVQRWRELRERFEPDSRKKNYEKQLKTGKQKRALGKAETQEFAPGPSSSLLEENHAKALDILEHGDPIAVMHRAFAQEHVGDGILATCLILSMASQGVKNSDGLHVSVTGESGKGKSHAFRKMMRQVPDRFKVKGTISNKALYYMTNLAPRSVLMSDDTELTDSIQEILKSATSNFNEPIQHTTVTKDLTCRVCHIPERCVWWIAKKEGTGDDQVMNRMLTCWIDESVEQDIRVLAAKQAKEELDPDTVIEESDELRISRAIWEILHGNLVWVIIPFSRRIRFSSIANRRNPDMLYDLIKSHAALQFMQREQKTAGDGTLCIYATEDDFTAASEVFTLLNGTSGGQESKLTRRESDLLVTIHRADRSEFTIQDLQELTGWSYSNIYKTMKGYDSRGKNYTGLLEKCPAISFTDRTVSLSEADGSTVRRRAEAFAWNRELYREWIGGGSCWLDRDPGDDSNKGDTDGGRDDTGSSPGSGRERGCSSRDCNSIESGSNNNDGSGDRETSTLPHLLHVSSNFAATAANQNRPIPGSGIPESCTNDNKSVQGNGSLLQKPDTATQENTTKDSGSHNDPCVQFAANAANENKSRCIDEETGKNPLQNAPIVCCTVRQTAANVQENSSRIGASTGPPRTIQAHDYKPLDSPEPKSPCYVCGHMGSWYVEKLTAERRARPKDRQEARRVCRACYKEAVRAEQMASVPLPGTVDVSRCERLTADMGRCSVCGLEKAAWKDRETGVKLCEWCYGREVRENQMLIKT